MAYITYIDGVLAKPHKDSTMVEETIYQNTDTETGVTYRIAFFPHMNKIMAHVMVRDYNGVLEVY